RQTGTRFIGGEIVGAGAHRGEAFLGSGLDDGDVQQGREAGVRAGQGYDYHPVPGGDSGHMGQPGAVPLGTLGPPQGGRRVRRRQGGPVGKGDAAAEGERVGEGGGVIGVALAQPRLGFQLAVQAEESLVDEGARHLLHTVGTGHRVQRLVRVIGKGERRREDHLLLLVGGLLVPQQAVGGLHGGFRPAAGQQQGHCPQQAQDLDALGLGHGTGPPAKSVSKADHGHLCA
ncbi:putative phosphoesterase or phosphohydrolase, partial [Dysosmobacter welbionis]